MGGMELGTIMAGSQALGSIGAGYDQERAYKAEAKQAEMQADQEEISRRRELNDALAMQAVMFGTQGRAAGEGSTKQIVQDDIKKAGEDVALIRASGRAQSAGLESAGRAARMKGYTNAISGAGKTAATMSQVK